MDQGGFHYFFLQQDILQEAVVGILLSILLAFCVLLLATALSGQLVRIRQIDLCWFIAIGVFGVYIGQVFMALALEYISDYVRINCLQLYHSTIRRIVGFYVEQECSQKEILPPETRVCTLFTPAFTACLHTQIGHGCSLCLPPINP